MLHLHSASVLRPALDRLRRGRGRVGAQLALVAALALALLSFAVVPARATTTYAVDIAPSAMSYTNLAWPFGNYAGEGRLSLSRYQFATYLTYDTARIAFDDEILSAELRLQVGEQGSQETGLRAWYTSTDWAADRLRYTNRPETTSEVISGPETAAPTAGSSVGLPLVDRSGVVAQGRVSFKLGFASDGQEVQLSTAQPPVLRVVVRTEGTPAPASTVLPYAVAPVGSSDKKVLAHYFPPYPISLDDDEPREDYYNRNYLDPAGENGKYRSVGGLLRDRPLPRPPLGDDYQLADATTEVRQASAAGIDGFTFNIMDWTGPLWDRAFLLTEAAEREGDGFVVVPNLDLSSNADDDSVEFIADRLAEMLREPAAYRLPDGRHVLSSFKAEERPPAWWQSVVTRLDEAHGLEVALISVLLDASSENLKAYAPVSYALSTWGVRTSTSILRSPDWAAQARAAGVRWMSPVAVQDVRHEQLTYAEAGNTEALRASWTRALADEADLVQLITWNDYSESTHFAPSVAHGSAFLDVNGYYLTQYKRGSAPAVTGDQLVLTHRIQKFDVRPTEQQSTMSPTLSGQSVVPRNTVEVLAMLRAPAVVTVEVGSSAASFSAPAGVSTFLVPLHEGTVSASASRDGVQVAQVTSPHEVERSLPFWDLQYYAASSRADRGR